MGLKDTLGDKSVRVKGIWVAARGVDGGRGWRQKIKGKIGSGNNDQRENIIKGRLEYTD
jgi:hypothetical protein